ncbi:Scr1 family TA system antitoxin-like transcriptional regulator [Marinitenerispora sediminis]|uniref:Scr1 family TA system antitoxin-like transcriptional regulator n=1 Tax=Marinitenerispora sediminis TaxID=1931232 RepID=UPI0011C01D30|nr:Scr1 family TA system antitoxin-like transcriptional regulator [Marinitenerispora sediminis]
MNHTAEVSGRGQLERLIEVSTWDRAEILIVPHPTWNHPGLDGGFRMLRLPGVRTILYLETTAEGSVIVAPALIEEHASLLGDLRALALPPDPSRALIDEVRGECT